MANENGNQTWSDINWATSERPWLTAVGGTAGLILGYAGGIELALWSDGGGAISFASIPAFVWFAILHNHALPGGLIAGITAFTVALLSAVVSWIAGTRQNVRHLRGIELHSDPGRAQSALKPFQGGLAGVHLHPKIQIGEHQECRHILLIGGAGAGKTTFLQHALDEIIKRGDRVLMLDFKGDFTKSLAPPFTLLSPTDARGSRWMLGQDVRTRLDALSFAETLIPLPKSAEPIWVQGARGLLVGLVAHLQTTRKTAWGFQDLAKIVAETLVDYKLLVKIIKRENALAKAFLMGADSKTTAGFLAQLAGGLTHVVELGISDNAAIAKAKRNGKKPGGWSVRAWLADTKTPSVAVIGWRASAKELSQAWAASIIEQTVRQLGDMPDCSPDKRRVWLILDEVAQCGHVPALTDALVTLRSKGVRVLLTVQSISQIEKNSDRQTLNIWSGSTATKIICQLSSPEDQKFASSLIGEREVERYTNQVTQNTTQGSGTARSGSWQRMREPVVLPSDLGHMLAPDARGINAILLNGSGSAARLRWPYYKAQARRHDRVAARWLSSKYKRPQWGVTPPQFAEPPPEGGDEGDDTQIAKPGPGPRPVPKPGARPAQQPRIDHDQSAPAARNVTVTNQPGQRDVKEKENGASDKIEEIAAGMIADTIAPGSSIVFEILSDLAPGPAPGPAGPQIISAPTAPPPAGPATARDAQDRDFWEDDDHGRSGSDHEPGD